MKAVVYVKFPKAGLGNMLLTWSRGYVFAEINNLQLFTSSWTGFHAGAWIRKERKKRLYYGYFKEKSFGEKLAFYASVPFRKRAYEPHIETITQGPKSTLFLFNKIFTDYDFFKEIRPYKSMVRKGLFETLSPALLQQFHISEKPVIGLHIRRGDFKRGSIITPLSFFVEAVNEIRKQSKKELPVTIFTDAGKDELKELFALSAVKIAEDKADVLDILLLASSKIVILSIGSTFSYWAAFLNDGLIIKHPKEWHVPFRANEDPLSTKEMLWNGSLKGSVVNEDE